MSNSLNPSKNDIALTPAHSSNGCQPYLTVGSPAASDVDAERQLLATLLVNPELDPLVAQLTPADFQIERNRWLFQAATALARRSEPVTVETVTDELRRMGRLPDLEHGIYVMEVAAELRSSYQGNWYARRLRDAKRRQLASTLPTLTCAPAARGDGDDSDPLSLVVTRLQEIDREFPRLATAAPEADALPASLYERLLLPTPQVSGGLGLVGELADLLGDQVGSPRSYNLLAALSTISAAVSQQAILHLSFGAIRPNLYAALVGPSSVYHKTTLINKVQRLLRQAGLQNLIIPSLPTSEGLLRRLSEQPAGILFRDELATLFGTHKRRYLQDLKQDLMALYECQPYSRELAQKTISVDEPYVSILGTTTPTKFFETVAHNDWHDGFLVRWLVALPDQLPQLDRSATLLTPAQQECLTRTAAQLARIAKQEYRDFTIDRDAMALWRDWRAERLSDAFQGADDLGLSFGERYATYALKIAMLLCIACGRDSRLMPGDVANGITLTLHYERCLLALREARQDYGLSGSKMQRVFLVIQKRGPITRKLLRDFTRYATAELDPVLDKLLEIGAILEQPAGRTKTYVAATERLPIRAW